MRITYRVGFSNGGLNRPENFYQFLPGDRSNPIWKIQGRVSGTVVKFTGAVSTSWSYHHSSAAEAMQCRTAGWRYDADPFLQKEEKKNESSSTTNNYGVLSSLTHRVELSMDQKDPEKPKKQQMLRGLHITLTTWSGLSLSHTHVEAQLMLTTNRAMVSGSN